MLNKKCVVLFFLRLVQGLTEGCRNSCFCFFPLFFRVCARVFAKKDNNGMIVLWYAAFFLTFQNRFSASHPHRATPCLFGFPLPSYISMSAVCWMFLWRKKKFPPFFVLFSAAAITTYSAIMPTQWDFLSLFMILLFSGLDLRPGKKSPLGFDISFLNRLNRIQLPIYLFSLFL